MLVGTALGWKGGESPCTYANGGCFEPFCDISQYFKILMSVSPATTTTQSQLKGTHERSYREIMWLFSPLRSVQPETFVETGSDRYPSFICLFH